jgi:hypothetical protein
LLKKATIDENRLHSSNLIEIQIALFLLFSDEPTGKPFTLNIPF